MMEPLLSVSLNCISRSPMTVSSAKSARKIENVTFFTAAPSDRPPRGGILGRSGFGQWSESMPALPARSSDKAHAPGAGAAARGARARRVAAYRLAFILALSTAWAAASLATGTRYGEQLT